MTIATTGAVTAVLVTLGVGLGGCGAVSASSSESAAASSRSASASSSAAAPAPRHVTVAIRGYRFRPAKLVVALGTKVTFANHDQTAHTATADGSGFDSGTIKPGASATLTFRKAGSYAYICQFHAFMTGTVVVR
jgi:plastocyanin